LKTASGLYFNEFDVRPGDSEGINFLHTLGEDCGALLGSIADGALQEPSMHEERVVVCVHHVPPGYPLDNQQRELVLNSDVLQNPQVYIGNLSYGEGEGYRTGFGRTMVTLGQGADVAEAREAAYRVSSLLPAVLRRRSDIGTF
jgi:phosphoribosylamine-glycine ligase